MNQATLRKARGISKKAAQVRHSFFTPIKEVYGFTQEHTFPIPLLCAPAIQCQGKDNERRKDKERVNLVLKK